MEFFILAAGLSVLLMGASSALGGEIPNFSDTSIRGATSMRTYAITETGRYSSLDPLDADATQNLPVARMIYATPLEMGLNERLVSAVLESFSYSNQTKEIVWKVRKGLKFDDGKDITAEDVAFSVVRMAYTRPRFPVIREIAGVASWAASKGALSTYPSGISVHGDIVTIRLSEPVDHPLFRFVLELFSIIPKRCVDLETNKLSCSKPPASGYYRMVSDTEEGLSFERRASFPSSVDVPKTDRLQFKYISAQEAIAGNPKLGQSFVIAGNETSFSKQELSLLESKYLLRSLPKSRFAEISLSSNAGAFQKAECRRIFLEKFRELLVESGMNTDAVEGSLTSHILPGYLTLQELTKRSTSVSDIQRAECKKVLRSERLEFGVRKSIRLPIAENALIKTLKYFGQTTTEPRLYESRERLTEDFVSGVCQIKFGSSGFWPQDPFGDLQMLFTPNLHKDLQFIAKDEALQRKIDQLRKPLPPLKRRALAEEFNLYIFEQGLMGVYRHTKRFYLSPKTTAQKTVPLALTSPAPWQVFD